MRLARFQRPDHWSPWSPLDQLTNIRDEINRLFQEPQDRSNTDAFNTWAPALDVYEDKDNVIVRAELPGLKKEDINVSLHENSVTISGQRKDEMKNEGAQTSRQERFYGRFTRSVTLPKQVDGTKVRASYQDGLLTVTMPKSEEAKPRQIQIQAS